MFKKSEDSVGAGVRSKCTGRRVVKRLAFKIVGAGWISVQSGFASKEISEARVEFGKQWVELQRQACWDAAAAAVGGKSDGKQG